MKALQIEINDVRDTEKVFGDFNKNLKQFFMCGNFLYFTSGFDEEYF